MGLRYALERLAWRVILAVPAIPIQWAPVCSRCGWRHTGDCWTDPCPKCGGVHTGDVVCRPAPGIIR